MFVRWKVINILLCPLYNTHTLCQDTRPELFLCVLISNGIGWWVQRDNKIKSRISLGVAVNFRTKGVAIGANLYSISIDSVKS